MSQFVEGGNKGYVCGAADLAEGVGVKIAVVSGVKTVVICTAKTDKCIGVTMGAYKIGEAASIRLRNAAGTMKVKAGGVTAIGDRLATTTDGTLITTTTAGDEVTGIALEVAANGDFIEAAPAGFTFYAIT